MKVKYQDIQEAYDFVSFGPYGEHSALLDKTTGQIHWHSESCDLDEIPEELWESESAVGIPHKNDLNLGRQLVFDFATSVMPDDYEHVRDIFNGRGAYARFKEFLESKGLVQKWYDFENKTQEKAIRDWCKENEIELEG